ncbi:MAG: peptidoglycan DD-metalloendopeptidase family protein, partial [Bacteroidetes bacterium]|nr:peptidoglycan DD-metalloendopeptidase family protein [Bacteroidota bacterium]
MHRLLHIVITVILNVFPAIGNAQELPATPLRVVAELNMGQTREVTLTNGERVKLTLLGIEETRDDVRDIIHEVKLRVKVDGEEVELVCGNYNLPVASGRVKIDCQVTKNYLSNSMRDHWKITNDARFRLWPIDAPYIKEGSFGYPIRQRWMASFTHSGNEPSVTGWGVRFDWKKIYYHEGHDIGGADGMDEIVSATDGLVVSIRNETMEGFEDMPLGGREDRLIIIDQRNWLYLYSHLDSTDPSIRPGDRVKKGEPLGQIGKKGGSGGIVHLHFGIFCKDEITGQWVVEDAYPYLWEAYKSEYRPKLKAIARPVQILHEGQAARLDGSKSIGIENPLISYEWYFGDGSKADGAIQNKTYERAGTYSEVLKITDSKGNIDYDFATVLVYDREYPEETKLGLIHLAYHPTLGLKAGDDISFLARTFHTAPVKTIWDFGDGTAPVEITTGGITKKNHSSG